MERVTALSTTLSDCDMSKCLSDGMLIIDDEEFVTYCNLNMKQYFNNRDMLDKKTKFRDLDIYEYFEGKLDGNEHELRIDNEKYVCQSFPVAQASNKMYNLIVIKDVTEKIHYKNITKIQQENSLLNLIIDLSDDGIYVTDAKGKGVRVNKAYANLTGQTEEELLGYNSSGTISNTVTFYVLKEKKAVTKIEEIEGREVIISGKPILDENGVITNVIINIKGINELNKLRLDLLQERPSSNHNSHIELFKQKEGLQVVLLDVVAQSKATIQALTIANKVAKVDSTVILLGESGVGKEVFANLIHTVSKRAKKPYIKINCGAIPPQLLESELFGYEKGAFTGADNRGKPGLFEQANGGTIFLDEIGELSLDLQVKLLRVLQEYEITRIGGRKAIKINIRVISATNRNLEEMVNRGKFRKDLFYRLNIIPIKIPALRERKEDIAALIFHFLNKTNNKYHFNKKIKPEVITRLENYDWPGNIREVENLIERLVVTGDSDVIELNDLPSSFRDEEIVKPEQTLKTAVENLEKQMIAEKLSEYKTTRKTARALGISQSALVKKMKRLKMT